MSLYFEDIFRNVPILITGHTGFKGSWLSIWLHSLGAKVIGYSLAPPTQPSHFSVTNLIHKMVHVVGDIKNYDKLYDTIQEHQPVFVFHLAAQSIVLNSYSEPKETFDVNLTGTVNVLEAVRKSPCVKGCMVITTDKCYENKEWLWGYRENDVLGGKEPYSASKAMAEMAVESYRTSFFNEATSKCVATARAGNVIGGGDFSEHRLVPDCIKALLRKEPIKVRNPQGVRPWLHVLDALSGYLCLASNLLRKGNQFAEAWNFGPLETLGVTVETMVEKAIHFWGHGDWMNLEVQEKKLEMQLLRLNWDKAAHRLKWRPVYEWEEALERTIMWFKSFQKFFEGEDHEKMYHASLEHIHHYCLRARELKVEWASTDKIKAEMSKLSTKKM